MAPYVLGCRLNKKKGSWARAFLTRRLYSSVLGKMERNPDGWLLMTSIQSSWIFLFKDIMGPSLQFWKGLLELERWFSSLTCWMLLQRTRVQFLAPIQGSIQLPLMLAPQNLMPSSGLLHTCACAYILIFLFYRFLLFLVNTVDCGVLL